MFTQYPAPCTHLGATHLWSVLTAKVGLHLAWGRGRSFVCLPAPAVVGGSHDSVLPKEGDVKTKSLRQGTQGTSLSSFPSALCPSPHPVLLAKLGRAQCILYCCLGLVLHSFPVSAAQTCCPMDHLSGCHSPQPEAGGAVIGRGCGSRMGGSLAARVEPPALARETLSAVAA